MMKMTTREFCIWLLGGFELGELKQLHQDEVDKIQAKLKEVQPSATSEGAALCTWLASALEFLPMVASYEKSAAFTKIRDRIVSFFESSGASQPATPPEPPMYFPPGVRGMESARTPDDPAP